MQKKYQVVVDLINPYHITEERLRENDINYCLGFDIITAMWFEGKKWSEEITEIFKNSKRNKIYPSWKLQNFVYRKGTYLKKFEKAGVPIAPTFLIRSTGKFDLARAKSIINRVRRLGWERFIIKPELGAGSYGFRNWKTSDVTPEIMLKYLNDHKKAFPGFMLQQAMDGFKKFWELRLWWYNGKFAYAIANKAKVATGTQEIIAKTPPKAEVEICKKIAKKIFPLLPKIPYNGKTAPPLAIRTDFGCCRGNTLDKTKYFLNEFELQAANYFTRHTTYPIIQEMGKAIIKKTEFIMGKKIKKN